VNEVRIVAFGVAAYGDQTGLFDGNPRRDLVAGARSLARIRARFGEKAVVRPVLEERHLPEEAFRWEEVDSLHLPRPARGSRPPLVRRLYTEPVRLSNALRARFVRARGSYVLSGWWWNVHPTEDQLLGGESVPPLREYRFAETDDGRLLWVYHDRERAAWFVQGEVL